MFNKNQFLLKSVFLCALAGMLVLYGCQPKAADIYTNYSDKTKAVNKVFLLHDALIFNDVSGEEHVVHVPKNLQSLHWINKSVSDIVHEKGYQVAGIKALTVGLQVGMGESYLVYLDASVENPDWGSADDLNKERTPLAVELQEIDEARLDDIASLHEDIGNTHYTNAKGLKFEQVRSFGLPEDSVLLVTQSFGVQVHLGKKMAQGIGSAILSLGGTADQDSDTTIHSLYILHPDTGEVLWADYFYETGGTRSERAIRSGLDRLFKELPDYDSQTMSG